MSVSSKLSRAKTIKNSLGIRNYADLAAWYESYMNEPMTVRIDNKDGSKPETKLVTRREFRAIPKQHRKLVR